jgi:hypothetical protein
LLPKGISYTEVRDVNQDACYIVNDIEMSDRDFEILETLYYAKISYFNERISELRRLLEETGE